MVFVLRRESLLVSYESKWETFNRGGTVFFNLAATRG